MDRIRSDGSYYDKDYDSSDEEGFLKLQSEIARGWAQLNREGVPDGNYDDVEETKRADEIITKQMASLSDAVNREYKVSEKPNLKYGTIEVRDEAVSTNPTTQSGYTNHAGLAYCRLYKDAMAANEQLTKDLKKAKEEVEELIVLDKLEQPKRQLMMKALHEELDHNADVIKEKDRTIAAINKELAWFKNHNNVKCAELGKIIEDLKAENHDLIDANAVLQRTLEASIEDSTHYSEELNSYKQASNKQHTETNELIANLNEENIRLTHALANHEATFNACVNAEVESLVAQKIQASEYSEVKTTTPSTPLATCCRARHEMEQYQMIFAQCFALMADSIAEYRDTLIFTPYTATIDKFAEMSKHFANANPDTLKYFVVDITPQIAYSLTEYLTLTKDLMVLAIDSYTQAQLNAIEDVDVPPESEDWRYNEKVDAVIDKTSITANDLAECLTTKGESVKTTEPSAPPVIKTNAEIKPDDKSSDHGITPKSFAKYFCFGVDPEDIPEDHTRPTDADPDIPKEWFDCNKKFEMDDPNIHNDLIRVHRAPSQSQIDERNAIHNDLIGIHRNSSQAEIDDLNARAAAYADRWMTNLVPDKPYPATDKEDESIDKSDDKSDDKSEDKSESDKPNVKPKKDMIDEFADNVGEQCSMM
jgi:hypothetical protein